MQHMKRSWSTLSTVMLLMTAVLTAHAQSPAIDNDDIGGVVQGDNSKPEAGVWVIAETDAFDTRFVKIVVTNDRGQFVIPDLPPAKYSVWVRGYGLADSTKQTVSPGARIEVRVLAAKDEMTAAQLYPAAYWYAMMELPQAHEVANLPGKVNEYAMWMKNMACVGCHQMGNLATRTFPPSLGKFASSRDAWIRRIQSGQAGGQMTRTAMGQLGGVPIKYLADWTDRIAAGELPAQKPARPSGLERNIVATIRDWADEKTYLHDLSGTDRRKPTVNAHGPLFGAPELSTDRFPILDPRKNTATTFNAPVRDRDTPTTRSDPVVAPSPYWGSEPLWDSKANAHNPMLDHRARVWYTARIRAEANPPFCKQGSSHPSAQLYPLERSSRHLAVYEPQNKKYTFVDTCFSTHHLQFAEDASHTLWTSGGGPVIGWLDTVKFDATGDAGASQGWAPFVVDTNGNGKLDRWTEPNQPQDSKLDSRIQGGFYAVMPNPADGSVWGSVAFRFPGALLRFDPKTKLTEVFSVPLPGYGVRGADIDRNGVVWVSLGSGHLGEFDRRKCKTLNGTTATGDHCPEGWRFHRFPGPGFKGDGDHSVESSYYSWVDQHDTLGLGANVPIATGNLFDGVHALVNGDFVTLRIPYPLGFYTKGFEGRIDDAKTDWKGRGLWVPSGDRTPWHKEGGKGTRPLVVHLQMRGSPLEK
jgi:hypothetical protein